MASSKAKSAKTKSSTGSKKQKKPKKSSLVVPDTWINELSHINIDDENWQCYIALMEEESTDASVYLDHFNEAAIKGRRLAIKVISRLEIIKTVTENMRQTNPDKEITPFSLLCSEIFNAVGSNFEGKIPVELLAPLIKYILLEYKRNNKTVKEGINSIQKDQEEYRQSLWQISKGKPNSSKGTRSTKRDSSTNKSKKVANGISKGKLFTKLRKRGEEWKDISWIEDAPIDGPQLYVTISTLFEPDLPLELLNFGITLNAIVRLNLIKTPSFSEYVPEDAVPLILLSRFQSLAEFKRKSTRYLSFNIGKHIDSEEMIKVRIKHFWNKINALKTNKETAQSFENIMFLQFVPEHQDFEYQVQTFKDEIYRQVQTFQEEIYRQVSYFLYDVFEISKHHKAYLNEMEIISVLDTCIISNLSGMSTYNSILDIIPQEVLNIPLILDALVAQVSGLTSDEKKTNSSKEDIIGTLSLDSIHSRKHLFGLLDSLNSKYDLFGDSIDLLMEENTAPSILENRNNLLIHGDEIRIKSFHLESEISQFVTNRTNYILRLGWKDVLSYANFSYHDESFTKLCNEIIKVEEETGHQGLYYFLYILITNSILNSLILTQAESNYRFNAPKDEKTEYNKDNLCEKCLIEISRSRLIPLAPITQFKSKVSCISDGLSTYILSDDVIATNLFYIEEMSSGILLQRIQSVASAFSSVESKTCPFTDQIVVLFHNLVNPRTLDVERNWVGNIITKIPVRDFVDYIIYEEEDWLKTQSNCVNVHSLKPTRTFTISMHDLDDRFFLTLADLDYISHRSIKYEIIMKQHLQKKSSPKITKVKSSNSPSKSSKKSNPNNLTKSSNKYKEEAANQEVTEAVSPGEIKLKKSQFLGYDLGHPIRFQYNGWKKDIILDDDCKIILNSTKLLYGEEYRSANLNIFGNDLYLHFNPNNIPYLENSFHLILSSGIILYFSMRTSEFDGLSESKNPTFSTNKQHCFDTLSIPIDPISIDHISIDPTPSQVLNIDLDDERDIKLSCATISEDCQTSNAIAYEIHRVNYNQIPTRYDLQMAMPSGLHTELVKYDNILYVRQSLLTKGPLSNTVEQEKYRCFLPSGFIIKSMLNGDFEILYGNGEIYYIFNEKSNIPNDSIGFKINRENNGISMNLENNMESNDKSTLIFNDNDVSQRSTTRTSTKKRKGSNESQKQIKTKTSKNNLIKLPTIQENLLSTKSYEEYSNYKFIGSNGECFLVQNGSRQNLTNLFISSSYDISNNCLNSERIDGVKSKHLDDGSLMVLFNDGSRITSTPIESDQLFSVWTPDEFEGWFTDLKISCSSENISIKTNDVNQTLYVKHSTLDNILGASMISLSNQNNNNYKEILEENVRNSSLHHSLCLNDTNNASAHFSSEHSDTSSQKRTFRKPSFVDDSFVVYNMSYLMEHPNYSSVFYDAQSSEIKFELPINTHLKLKLDGSYEASFEGANLNVYDDSIEFSRVKKDSKLRTITINNTGFNIPGTPKSLSLHKLKLMRKNYNNLNQINNQQPHCGTNFKNVNPYDSFFLYSTDPFRKEIFIDYDFNCYEIPMGDICNETLKGDKFSCFVINKDLSGFRLVSDNEVDNHLVDVTKENGIVIRSGNEWSSLLSILPVKMNESERWLMRYNMKVDNFPFLGIRSTFGKRESWIHPFVEADAKEAQLNLTDAVILRLLHRIPTDKNTLEDLTSALEMFKKASKNLETKKINPKVYLHDLNLNEILTDPSLLSKIYGGEIMKRTLEEDKFRKCIKEHLLITLVHQACIKARKRIIKIKENELKAALRNKKIPPYHLSCFGQVHEILDEVVENTVTLQTFSSNSSIYEKINCIIDEILEFSVKRKSNTSVYYSSQSETGGTRVEGIIDEIFQNICNLEKENIEVTRILEKPLRLVNAEEVEFVCSRFEPGSRRCQTFYIEDIILQDVLEARLQQSHYFKNIREMLLYYKSRNIHSVIAEGE